MSYLEALKKQPTNICKKFPIITSVDLQHKKTYFNHYYTREDTNEFDDFDETNEKDKMYTLKLVKKYGIDFNIRHIKKIINRKKIDSVISKFSFYKSLYKQEDLKLNVSRYIRGINSENDYIYMRTGTEECYDHYDAVNVNMYIYCKKCDLVYKSYSCPYSDDYFTQKTVYGHCCNCKKEWVCYHFDTEYDIWGLRFGPKILYPQECMSCKINDASWEMRKTLLLIRNFAPKSKATNAMQIWNVMRITATFLLPSKVYDDVFIIEENRMLQIYATYETSI